MTSGGNDIYSLRFCPGGFAIVYPYDRPVERIKLIPPQITWEIIGNKTGRGRRILPNSYDGKEIMIPDQLTY